jgi:hypothetical protein
VSWSDDTVDGVRARREQVVMGAVAAAVLVAIVALAAAGGGVKRATATPTPTPPPERGDRPLFGGSLEPRVRYRTRAFVPALSFAVADSEWIVDDATQPDRLLLVRRIRSGAPGGERDPRSYLSFSRAPVPAGRLRRALRSDRRLLVGRPRPTLVAGIPAQRFRVALRFRDPATACRTLLLVCTTIPPGRYLTAGTQMRRTVLTTASGPLVIDLIGATQRDLDRVEAPAARVLRTLRIGAR